MENAKLLGIIQGHMFGPVTFDGDAQFGLAHMIFDGTIDQRVNIKFVEIGQRKSARNDAQFVQRLIQ